MKKCPNCGHKLRIAELSNSAQFRRVEEQQKRISHLEEGLRKIAKYRVVVASIDVTPVWEDIAKEYLGR